MRPSHSINHTNDSDHLTRRYLIISGFLAALVMTVFMLALRGVTDPETLAEIVANGILELVPIQLFSFVLQIFKGLAKPLLLGSVIIGMAVVGSLIAVRDRGPALNLSIWGRLKRMLIMSIGLWIPFLLLALLITMVRPAMSVTITGLIDLAVILLADFVVYTLSLYLIYPLVSGGWAVLGSDDGRDHPPEDLGRRRLLGRIGTGAVAAGAAVYLGGFLSSIRAGAGGDDEAEIPPPITPNGEFYTVSKNFVDPGVGLDDWSLRIDGMVEQPVTLSYEQLQALPRVDQMATLICISNEVGGDLIDNTIWTGVKLSDVLAEAGISGAPAKVAFFGDDGYSDSFELSKALEPTTIIAYWMNDERLPKSHGFPARLIVPGKYGIKNGKWLTRIELVDDFEGYWQERGWTDEARIKTMSRFDVPGSRAIVSNGAIELGGVAFAGDRGIQAVEYSTDDGRTWVPAEQVDVIAPLSWAIWRASWTPPASGTYTLKVRATDGEGNLQTAERADPIPDGASGYHRITIGIT